MKQQLVNSQGNQVIALEYFINFMKYRIELLEKYVEYKLYIYIEIQNQVKIGYIMQIVKIQLNISLIIKQMYYFIY